MKAKFNKLRKRLNWLLMTSPKVTMVNLLILILINASAFVSCAAVVGVMYIILNYKGHKNEVANKSF